MIEKIRNKRVVFITTKNLDYIRNLQEQELIRKEAKSCEVIGSNSKKYPVRLLTVYWNVLRRRFQKDEVVFVGFAPQLVLPFLSFKFKKNYVMCDFFISMYDTLVYDRKKFTKNSIPGKLCKWLDIKTVKKADYMIADTRAHKEYFCEAFGAKPANVEVLYIIADKGIYYPREGRRTRHQDKFLVLYFGSILPLQGVDVIIEAARRVTDQKIVFYIIGPVKNEVLPENVVNIPWLSQKDLAEHIAMADLCLAGHFNANNNKAKRTIPGKAYIYEMMEKPMILGDNPATHELYQEDDMHFFVEMGNPQALAERIMELRSRLEGRTQKAEVHQSVTEGQEFLTSAEYTVTEKITGTDAQNLSAGNTEVTNGTMEVRDEKSLH